MKRMVIILVAVLGMLVLTEARANTLKTALCTATLKMFMDGWQAQRHGTTLADAAPREVMAFKKVLADNGVNWRQAKMPLVITFMLGASWHEGYARSVFAETTGETEASAGTDFVTQGGCLDALQKGIKW